MTLGLGSKGIEVLMERNPLRPVSVLLLVGLAALVGALALASSAGAAAGTWERAWGKNVNGGGVFGICTVPASCLTGSTGGLGGEMSNPVGVATDAAGNVYLADLGNHRIQKFDSSGTWERAWGKNVNGGGVFGICTVAASCQAGSQGGLGGEMIQPAGVAVGPDGSVYVADTGNSRIQKFDSSGNWERAWGKNVNGGGVFGVCTVAASCFGNFEGGLGGEMWLPTGVAVDADGKVYVGDMFNHRVQKFDSSGTWERAWGKNVNGGGVFGVCTVAASCQAGTTGGLGGEMFQPKGVAVDAGGKVHVADALNQRIQRFDPSGTWERAWGRGVNGGFGFGVCTVASSCLAGSPGGLGGEMSGPKGLATDAVGKVYVSEEFNDRFQRFDSAGTWERAWGKNVNGGGVFGVCTVAASCQTGTSGSLGGEMDSPEGIATGADGKVYVGDSGNNRIQKFDPARATISTQATISATAGAQISDQARLSGGSSPTGTITFTAYGPNDATCAGAPAYTSNAVTVSGNGNYANSPAFTPAAVGTYRWRASYSGDINNPAVSTPCNDSNETSTVAQATPGLTTQATPTATIGALISDQATLSGGAAATGTISFTAYGPGDTTCAVPVYTSDPIPVSGNGTYTNSPAFAPAALGTYRWRASYSGDANNNAVAGACNAPNETSTVVQATPSISTQATPSATLGNPISDQATLSGGSNPTGTITFMAYGPNDATCAGAPAYTSNAVTVSGNGNYGNSPTFIPGTIGTYRWRAFYSGDANNVAVATSCNDPNETSVVTTSPVTGVIPPVLVIPPAAPTGPTGQRAAALKKCKKKRGRARRNCMKRANKLPV